MYIYIYIIDFCFYCKWRNQPQFCFCDARRSGFFPGEGTSRGRDDGAEDAGGVSFLGPCPREVSIDWFKGKIAGKSHIYPCFMGKSMVSGSDFPLSEPIEGFNDLTTT